MFIVIVRQLAMIPVPRGRENMASIDPWNTTVRGGEGFDAFRSTSPLIERFDEIREPDRPVLVTDEQMAECAFIKCHVLFGA